MPEILLIHPLEYKRDIFTKSKEKYNIPIAIWYLGSYLRSKGISVKLIDFESDSRALERLKETAAKSRLIGITMMTAQVGHALNLAKFIKNEIADIPIVAGGVHPTLYPIETVKSDYIDFTVYGEGEIAILELIRSINENKRDYYNIGGIAYKDRDEIFFNKAKSRFADHFNYPDLDYGLLDEKILSHKYSLPLVTSRGCPYDCTFCCNSAIRERNTVHSWSLQKIVYEVKRAIDFGFKDIFFWDDNFFQKKETITGFLEEIKRIDRKFTWFGNARADYFNDRYLSVELLTELNKYGLTRISIGAESGSQRMLDYMKKGIKVEHILRAAQYCVEANIEPSFSFMVGLPREETQDLYLTMECLKKLCKILSLPKILGPMLYLPLPGTIMFDDCIQAGFRPPKTINDWAGVDSGYGFTAYDRPWIRNSKLVRIVWFYSILIPASYAKIIKVMKKYSRIVGYSKLKESTLIILMILGSILGKIRYRFKFFKLPIETIIFKNFRSLNSL